MRKRAFTLIELLIVVAIIGILATVVILNVAGARTKATDAKVADDIATIARAAEIAKAEGSLPEIQGMLVATNASDLVNQAFATNCTPDFSSYNVYYAGCVDGLKDSSGKSLLGKTPTHPISGQRYFLFTTASHGGIYEVGGQLATKPTYTGSYVGTITRVQIQVTGRAAIQINMQATDGNGAFVGSSCYDNGVLKTQCMSSSPLDGEPLSF